MILYRDHDGLHLLQPDGKLKFTDHQIDTDCNGECEDECTCTDTDLSLYMDGCYSNTKTLKQLGGFETIRDAARRELEKSLQEIEIQLKTQKRLNRKEQKKLLECIPV